MSLYVLSRTHFPLTEFRPLRLLSQSRKLRPPTPKLIQPPTFYHDLDEFLSLISNLRAQGSPSVLSKTLIPSLKY